MSTRMRGESPYAVPFRMNTGEKSSSARTVSPSSARTFDSAYAVTGRSGASSSTNDSSAAAPYMLQDEEKTNRRTPASFAASCKAQRPSQVDVLGPASVQVAERVVGERRQVDDRVEAGEVLRADVAHVRASSVDRLLDRVEVAAGVVGGVQADDLVPGAAQDGPGERADVPLVPGDEDPHRRSGAGRIAYTAFASPESTVRAAVKVRPWWPSAFASICSESCLIIARWYSRNS